MSLYHFSLGHVSRGAGQSAVASAAYISGSELYSEYYGEWSDYTRKGGVIYTEIILPDNAPKEFMDRETLWNAVENVEKNKRAQLAYSFNIALQNELSTEDNLDLARAFIMENFVSRGMICDFALHAPDPKEGGTPNPHFHVLAPIRPLDENGKWGAKQHREYRLDEKGERIRKPNGEYDFISVPTTDWGNPETLEEWRKNWAEMVNRKFMEKGLDCHIDNRSYLRQGIDRIPTIYEGPAVRAMERKGIRTRKGDFNRFIKKANEMLKKLHDEISGLCLWIKTLKEVIDEMNQKEPMVMDFVNKYYDLRNQGAYSQKAKLNNLKARAKTYNFLSEHGITNFDSFEAFSKKQVGEVNNLREKVKANEKRSDELTKLIGYLDNYEKYKPVFDQKYKFRWKKDQEAYSKAHASELTLFNTARRILKESHPEGKIPNRENLERELDSLESKYPALYEQYAEKSAVTSEIFRIKRIVNEVTSKEHKVKTKIQEMER